MKMLAIVPVLVSVLFSCSKGGTDAPSISYPTLFTYEETVSDETKVFVITNNGFQEIPASGKFAEFEYSTAEETGDAHLFVLLFNKINLLTSTSAHLSNDLQDGDFNGLSMDVSYKSDMGKLSFDVNDGTNTYPFDLTLSNNDSNLDFWIKVIAYSKKDNNNQLIAYSPLEGEPVSAKHFDQAANDVKSNNGLSVGDTIAINYTKLVFK